MNQYRSWLKWMPKLFLNGTVGSEITADRVKNFLASEKSKDITVVINSVGGSVFEGIEVYNMLKNSGRNITTVISGLAASMGSIIFLAGEERIAMEGTLFMVHKPSTFSWGDSDDLRGDADLLDKIQDSLEAIYNDRTNINNVNDMVNKTSWFTVEDMAKNGVTNSNRKVILFEEGESNEQQNNNNEEELITMGKIDDLKAELEEQKKINAELAEKAEEAKLEAELAELKATNAALQTTETQTDTETETNEEETETVEDPQVEPVAAEVVVETPKAQKQPEIIETKNAVAETTNKNELPAFMQATSKY